MYEVYEDRPRNGLACGFYFVHLLGAGVRRCTKKGTKVYEVEA